MFFLLGFDLPMSQVGHNFYFIERPHGSLAGLDSPEHPAAAIFGDSLLRKLGNFIGSRSAGSPDTSEVLAPKDPQTLPRSSDSRDLEMILGHFRGPRTAGTSDTFEVRAPQDPRKLSSSSDSRNLGNFRGPVTPRAVRNQCGKKNKKY